MRSHSWFPLPAAVPAAALLAVLLLPLGAAEKDPPKPVPWSFKPLAVPPLTALHETTWPQTRVDHHVLARLEAEGLAPAAPAPVRMLVRRLYFDVIGLPPTPAEMARWTARLGGEKAPQPEAAGVSELIEELLASPHYGERWARYWLDLARYTDQTASWLESTSGAWLYRDWVVRAFNEDLPYDQFVIRQLATDALPETGPEDLHALGFLGLSPTYWKELLLPPELIKGTVADEWEEHVDAVGRTFLGLTLACARCHDHKSDPITNADYYGIAGVFASVKLTERPTLSAELWAPVAKAKEAVGALEKERDALKKKKPVPADLKEQVAALESRMATIKSSTPHYNVPMANAIEDAALYVVSAGEGKGTKMDYQPGKARDLEIMVRGDPNHTSDLVPRRFLSAFPMPEGSPRRFSTGSGRLDLARALVSEAAPLTARVLVNRVWQHHFGRGIVGTPSEFGALGEKPTHPGLLDDLTQGFIDHGWSIKWLHREILRSATWQQSSQAIESERRDPENHLLARMSRRRLDFESWRDAMLAGTGTLNPQLGGPSMALTDAANQRRSLYGTIHRHEMEPMLRLHDFPDPASHSPARIETTTPLQLLFTLNSPFIQQQSDALVGQIRPAQGTAETARTSITRAYEALFQRPPTEREWQLGSGFLEGRESQPAVWSEYAQALLGSNELLYLD
ncbi:MAG: DUF1553 domain-containing protein [Verrucomicrobiae bacterium]|nr:DUF1553 domain-containing protein [Verrucomicrobiae bacterium]